jgi:CheY-like chemotaxis protein
MRILVTGTEGSGIDRVERDLQAAGHETTACASGPAARGRCRGTEDKSACPFVGGGVDVIVAARQRPLPHLTKQEQLVECVLLNDIPLVVVGSTVMNPYGKRAAVLVEGFDEVVAACEAAVTAPSPQPDGA